ncbi:MAG: BspA family leucine-rich repeat surface protein [Patescibacteria group bacterium]|jgi:surface protein|nr:BspA family leucine-rich repeat surface protein [Patescibacteria group bacterium]
MNAMFSNCPNLTGLDLSTFDTRKVTNMDNMFSNDFQLTTITVGPNFTTEKL